MISEASNVDARDQTPVLWTQVLLTAMPFQQGPSPTLLQVFVLW